MRPHIRFVLGLAMAWLVGTMGALAEEAPGDEPQEPPAKSRQGRGRSKTPGKNPGKTPTGPPTKAPAKPPAKTPAKTPAKAPAKRTPPGQGEPKGEEEGEEGAVFVLQDSDAVVLRDGTRIDGTILCAGQAAVTILTPEGERTIPREQIERIIKNSDAGFPKKFKAEELDGHKYLQDEEAAEGEAAGEEGGPPGPKLVATPGVRPAPAPAPKPAPKAPAPAGPPAARPAAPPAAPKPAAPAPPQPPKAPAGVTTITLPKDPAQLRAFIEQLRRDGKLDALLKDPRALEILRKALREQAGN